MKKIAIVTLLLAAGCGGWWYWSKNAHRKPNPGSEQRYIAKAVRRHIDFNFVITGDVTPAFQLDVKPEVGGKVKRLYVEEGQEVKKGDLLCEIDDTDLLTERLSGETDIAGAKLSVEKNERNFNRARELFDSKLISQEVFDNVRADLLLAQNALEKAEHKLQIIDDRIGKTRIVSPTHGTVLVIPIIEGQVVTAAASVNSGSLLMSIADLSKLVIGTHINQVDITRLKPKQKVHVSTEALPDMKLDARISFVAPVATIKGSIKGFKVEAIIDGANPRLRPGMTVNLTIPVASAENAVSVPIAGVFEGDHDSKVVYVLNGETTERRKVEVGISNLNHAEIKSGLEAGEQILLVDPRQIGKKS